MSSRHARIAPADSFCQAVSAKVVSLFTIWTARDASSEEEAGLFVPDGEERG